jgi:peptidoglycan hydrolase CwlO-like protein
MKTKQEEKLEKELALCHASLRKAHQKIYDLHQSKEKYKSKSKELQADINEKEKELKKKSDNFRIRSTDRQA